ncbi:hypothetical protein CBR_g164 [Chara braunii]|uniref:Zinc transporter n=1 Tax=Chara braunii TaxID=69332 RepID=A0A388JLS3_CHABU|nr:hypothetical protein CBR_g164 [Chara braunii]|eukprot:GBG58764.1 hypothetical protein CBR_g164 [Chara braunii]
MDEHPDWPSSMARKISSRMSWMTTTMAAPSPSLVMPLEVAKHEIWDRYPPKPHQEVLRKHGRDASGPPLSQVVSASRRCHGRLTQNRRLLVRHLLLLMVVLPLALLVFSSSMTIKVQAVSLRGGIEVGRGGDLQLEPVETTSKEKLDTASTMRMSFPTENSRPVAVPPPPIAPTKRGVSERLLRVSSSSVGDTASSSKRPSRVSLASVGLLTLGMALASGLGALPFFFFKLSPAWSGICNGIACGVMLAASFDLVSEGQVLGGGGCVVIGILAGGLFILSSQRLLDEFGEVSVLDLQGADARKMVIVVAIMTLHAFGEGAGVGVSFAGPKGLPQGLMVTIAIGIHNIPEGLAVALVLVSKGVSPWKALGWSILSSIPQPLVAVPAFACAETFNRFLPLCLGFAAGCMIWMVFGAVMPDGMKDTSPNAVATAATLSVAIMESVDTLMNEAEKRSSDPFHPSFLLLSLALGLGPLVIGTGSLVVLRRTVRNPSPFLMGLTAGILLTLSCWRTAEIHAAGQLGLARLLALLFLGIVILPLVTRSMFSSSHGLPKATTRQGRSKRRGVDSPKKGSRGLDLGVLQAGKGGTSSSSIPTPSLLHPVTFSITVLAALAVHLFSNGLSSGAELRRNGGVGATWETIFSALLSASLQGWLYGMVVAMIIMATRGGYRSAMAGMCLTGTAAYLGVHAALVHWNVALSSPALDACQVVASAALICSVPAWLPQRNLVIAARKTTLGVVLGATITAVSVMCSKLVHLRITQNSAGINAAAAD